MRGVNNEDLSYLFKKVVFYLHSSFQNPIRCTHFPNFRNLQPSLRNPITRLGWVRNHDRAPFQPSIPSNSPNSTHATTPSLTSRRRPSIQKAIMFISLRRSRFHVNGRALEKDHWEKGINGRQSDSLRVATIIKRFCSNWPATQVYHAILSPYD